MVLSKNITYSFRGCGAYAHSVAVFYGFLDVTLISKTKKLLKKSV